MLEDSYATENRDRISDWVLRGGVAFAFVLFGLDKFPFFGCLEVVRRLAPVMPGQSIHRKRTSAQFAWATSARSLRMPALSLWCRPC